MKKWSILIFSVFLFSQVQAQMNQNSVANITPATIDATVEIKQKAIFDAAAQNKWDLVDQIVQAATADVIQAIFIHAATLGLLPVIQHFATTQLLRGKLSYKSIDTAFNAADQYRHQEVVAYFVDNDLIDLVIL